MRPDKLDSAVEIFRAGPNPKSKVQGSTNNAGPFQLYETQAKRLSSKTYSKIFRVKITETDQGQPISLPGHLELIYDWLSPGLIS